ncbi:hypothetical protein HNY73_016731 [Argiope bruennichi]|uniref:Uncharacterized protein n=1 Tax=Argiope bruennichi TaxID=94029 RepID=A0A8T0EPQ3_ARGBR|nr:hypothetical protein HNY73_016731 [Argiope bruennichi]
MIYLGRVMRSVRSQVNGSGRRRRTARCSPCVIKFISWILRPAGCPFFLNKQMLQLSVLVRSIAFSCHPGYRWMVNIFRTFCPSQKADPKMTSRDRC